MRESYRQIVKLCKRASWPEYDYVLPTSSGLQHDMYPMSERWNAGRYEYGKKGDPFLFKYTDGNGATHTYGEDDIAPYWNLKRSGVLDLPLDRQNKLTYSQVGAALTGNPNYERDMNEYMASIPDDVWDRLYKPVSADVRRNYSWGAPARMPYDSPAQRWRERLTGASNAWFSPRYGTVTAPENDKQQRQLSASDRAASGLFRPKLGLKGALSRVLDILGRRDRRVEWESGMRALSGFTPGDRFLTNRHESNHWAQVPVVRNGDSAATNYRIYAEDPDRLSREVSRRHPEMHERLVMQAPMFRNTYTGFPLEEAQAARSFRDGLEGLQTMARTRGAKALNMSDEDHAGLLALNPRPTTQREFRASVDWMRAHPAIALRLGAEPARLLNMADDYDMMSKYVPFTNGRVTWDKLDQMVDTAMSADPETARAISDRSWPRWLNQDQENRWAARMVPPRVAVLRASAAGGTRDQVMDRLYRFYGIGQDRGRDRDNFYNRMYFADAGSREGGRHG